MTWKLELSFKKVHSIFFRYRTLSPSKPFRQKIKWGVCNCSQNKLMEFLLFNEVWKKFNFFFEHRSKKLLILSKFKILKTDLWLIYSKIFEFMVFTLIFLLWEIITFIFLRPPKTVVQVQEFQNFEVYLKKLGIRSTFLKILSCI